MSRYFRSKCLSNDSSLDRDKAREIPHKPETYDEFVSFWRLGVIFGHSKEAEKEDATSMAARQREIAVSGFSKNRHLLGFDNLSKALLTTVREAVDNALDACEEAHILPEIHVTIKELSETKFSVTIEDNGPGILKSQLPKIFAKLLYGSKFHRLKQSRGQQGIGISAAVMYGQMTTGQPAVVISKTSKGKPAHKLKLNRHTEKPTEGY